MSKMIDRRVEFAKIDTDLFPFHHRAVHSGYVSRKSEGTGYFAYKGVYGLGYVRYVPNMKVAGTCYVEYYIYKAPAKGETTR